LGKSGVFCYLHF